MSNLRIDPKMKLTKEPLLAGAIAQARAALLEVTPEKNVGAHAGLVQEAERLVTHAFTCLMPGYRGWYWTVTLARAPRSKKVTINEIVLRPGEEALLAPEWVPWADRLRPGDIGPADRLPYNPNDPNLQDVAGEASAELAGQAADTAAAAAQAAAAESGSGAAKSEKAAGAQTVSAPNSEPAEAAQPFDPDLKQGYEAADIDADRAAQWELGLGRARVLSESGRADTFRRWYRSDAGPKNQATRDAKEHCATCGYFMKMAGSARQLFGVCANEWSPFDGRAVSTDHGCGAHSETDVKHKEKLWVQSQPVINENDLEVEAARE